MTLQRISSRYVIATAVIVGAKIAHVARQLGVSRSWASREANSAGVRCIVRELLEARSERVGEVFDKVLTVLEEAMHARLHIIGEGQVFDVGPDHYARLEAVKVFIALMRAAEGYRAPPIPDTASVSARDLTRTHQRCGR